MQTDVSDIVSTNSSKKLDKMGSLEEEMAKLEEADFLDTSIECESQAAIHAAVLTANEEAKEEINKSINSQEVIDILPVDDATSSKETVAVNYAQELIKEINSKISNETLLNVDIDDLKQKLDNVQSNDLVILMDYINNITLKVAQINNLILQKFRSSK